MEGNSTTRKRLMNDRRAGPGICSKIRAAPRALAAMLLLVFECRTNATRAAEAGACALRPVDSTRVAAWTRVVHMDIGYVGIGQEPLNRAFGVGTLYHLCIDQHVAIIISAH